jgi:hypothetical protein
MAIAKIDSREVPPTGFQRFVDRHVTRLGDVPRVANGYTVTRDLRIPARDGVELWPICMHPSDAHEARYWCAHRTVGRS